jgi:hypothetical protein
VKEGLLCISPGHLGRVKQLKKPPPGEHSVMRCSEGGVLSELVIVAACLAGRQACTCSHGW